MEENAIEDKEAFYTKAQDYWKSIPATLDGVLGGYGHISFTDIRGSEKFLRNIFKIDNPPRRCRALDCGAGIGRITKELLIRFFDKVDIVEQNEDFVKKAPSYIGQTDRLGNCYISGLQDFEPEFKYDIIWCQWVLGHLTDSDLIKFFKTCCNALSENGIIIVKENVTSSTDIELDKVDSSVTRPLDILLDLFEKAGLKPVELVSQTGFPKHLFPVKMIALVPYILSES